MRRALLYERPREILWRARVHTAIHRSIVYKQEKIFYSRIKMLNLSFTLLFGNVVSPKFNPYLYQFLIRFVYIHSLFDFNPIFDTFNDITFFLNNIKIVNKYIEKLFYFLFTKM